jgi:hypothetical protein
MHLNFVSSVHSDDAAGQSLIAVEKGAFVTWQATPSDVRLSYKSASDGKPVHLRILWDVSADGDLIVSIASDMNNTVYASIEELVASRMYLRADVEIVGSAAAVPALQPLSPDELAGDAMEEGAGLRQRIRHRPPADISRVIRRGINPRTGKYEVHDPSQSWALAARRTMTPRFMFLLCAMLLALYHAVWLVSVLTEHHQSTAEEAGLLTGEATLIAKARVTELREGLHQVLAAPHAPGACETTVHAWAVDTARAVQPLQASFMDGVTRHKLTDLGSIGFVAWLLVLSVVFVGSGRKTPEDLDDEGYAKGERLSYEEIVHRQTKEPRHVVYTGRFFYVVLLLSYAVLLSCAYMEQGAMWDMGGVQSAFDDRFIQWHSYHGWWMATGSSKHAPGPTTQMDPTVLAAMLNVPVAEVSSECVVAVDEAAVEYANGVPHILMLPLQQPLAGWVEFLASISFETLSYWVLPAGQHAHTSALAYVSHGTDPDGTPEHAALGSVRFVMPSLTYAARGSVCIIPALFVTVIGVSYLRQMLLDGFKWVANGGKKAKLPPVKVPTKSD